MISKKQIDDLSDEEIYDLLQPTIANLLYKSSINNTKDELKEIIFLTIEEAKLKINDDEDFIKVFQIV